MESRRIRVMRNPASGRPQHETEVPVEVLNVRVATDSERVLPEAEGGHCLVIERLGTAEVAHFDIDVVYSDDFGHGCEDSGLWVPGFRYHYAQIQPHVREEVLVLEFISPGTAR